ncbi:MAG: histone family protein [Methanobrevibacter sp.]|jgi:histone H3/H4|nr:histone family protein [Candidatus Methanovirga australis]
MSEIPIAPLVRILKNAGADRVSDDAKTEFANAVESCATDLAKKAIEIAGTNKRKTVKPDDIKAAFKSCD